MLGARGEEREFGLGLDVEEEDTGGEGGVNFGDLLADPGEDGLADGSFRRPLDAGEFSAGDDVEAGPMGSEELENGER